MPFVTNRMMKQLMSKIDIFAQKSKVVTGLVHSKDHAPSPLCLSTYEGGVVIEGAWSSRGRGHRGGVVIGDRAI